MKGALRFGLPVALVLGLAAVAAIPSLRSLSDSGSIPVVEVRRGDFVHRVEADGVLTAENATVLTTPVSADGGLKVAWLAEDGSRVAEDDLVVRFDPTDMENDLANGRSERSKAENRKLKQGIEDETNLDNLGRDAGLAALELDYANEFQSKDPEIFSRIEIIESEIDSTLASKRKSHAEEAREIHRDLGSVELDLLDIEKRRAELKIERAESGLRDLEIRAPHDGIFVLRRDWGDVPRVGEVIWPGQPVAEIPQLDVMKAEVFVLEADAGGLAEDVEAEVKLESHPGESFRARVRKVAALAKRRTRWSPVQYFEVELELEQSDPDKMKPGQRVRAALILEQADDVLSIPREAVFEDDDGGRHVFRRSGGEFEPVEVELGPTALGRVVVTSGLSEGDRVALQDPTRTTAETEDDAGTSSGLNAPGGTP